ncbi:hypothetical protein AHF37_07749 [Paragonimus kellicotti]|nr:hypothetical protein AHF37_07749 [Paragonimus kellicotti]
MIMNDSVVVKRTQLPVAKAGFIQRSQAITSLELVSCTVSASFLNSPIFAYSMQSHQPCIASRSHCIHLDEIYTGTPNPDHLRGFGELQILLVTEELPVSHRSYGQ